MTVTVIPFNFELLLFEELPVLFSTVIEMNACRYTITDVSGIPNIVE